MLLGIVLFSTNCALAHPLRRPSINAFRSTQVPDVLAPFAGALTPIVESILSTDLKRFADLAVRQA